MSLKAVSDTMDAKVREDMKWDERATRRIGEWLGKDKGTNKHGQFHLADFAGVLNLPNTQIPSDHMPIAALFELKPLCCADMKQITKAKKKQKKKKNKKQQAMERNIMRW